MNVNELFNDITDPEAFAALCGDFERKETGAIVARCPACGESGALSILGSATKMAVYCLNGCSAIAIHNAARGELVTHDDTFDDDDLGLMPTSMLTMNDATLSWLVRDLFPTEGMTLLYAAPGAGKSSFARWLAHCVATGKDFLGYEVCKGVALYFAVDEPRQTARLKAWPLRHDAFIQSTIRPDPVTFPQRLRRAVEKYNASLVVVDTIGKMLPTDDTNAYGKVSRGLSDLRKAVRDAHLLLLHHDNKMSGHVNGSRAFEGEVDAVYYITPKTHELKLEKERVARLDEPVCLTLDKTTGEVTTSSVATGETLISNVVKVVLDAQLRGEKVIKKDFDKRYRKDVGPIPTPVARAALDEAVASGRLRYSRKAGYEVVE